MNQCVENVIFLSFSLLSLKFTPVFTFLQHWLLLFSFFFKLLFACSFCDLKEELKLLVSASVWTEGVHQGPGLILNCDSCKATLVKPVNKNVELEMSAIGPLGNEPSLYQCLIWKGFGGYILSCCYCKSLWTNSPTSEKQSLCLNF